MSENRKSKKNLLSVIIPIALAVAVILGLAVSGNITKKRDLDTPTASVSQAVPQTTVAPDTKVNIVAVGDNLIHNTLIAAGEQEDGTRDYSSFYENMKPYISAADMAVID